MALKFHPNAGAILHCDYSTGFRSPEMIKPRPVVVITPRLRNRDSLCAVVPLSLTDPHNPQAYHLKVKMSPLLPPPWDSPECWAKADMMATVSYERLTPYYLGRGRDGKRIYYTTLLKPEVIREIQRAVLWGLNLGHLTQHV